MTQRRKKRRSRFGRRAFLAGAGCAALAGVGLMLRRGQTVSACRCLPRRQSRTLLCLQESGGLSG